MPMLAISFTDCGMVMPVRSEERSRLCAVGVRLHGERHVRHGVEHGAAFALDQFQAARGIETVLQHDAAAMRHHREQRVGAAKTPEQRDDHEQPVLLCQAQPLADAVHVADQALVQQRHRLGARGRARGEQQIRHVVRSHGRAGGVEHGVRHVIAHRAKCGVAERARRLPLAQADDMPQLRELAHPGQFGDVIVLEVAVRHHQHGGIAEMQGVV